MEGSPRTNGGVIVAELFDECDFRRALGRFPTGVTIVTAAGGSDPADWVGVTANSFSSVSLQPPMVLWSLGRNSRSFDTFAAASHFAVQVLAENQQELSSRFARSIDDKFRGLACKTGAGGVPLLPDCVACLQCRTAHAYEGGDHLILVGEVLSFSHFDRVPLVFHEGRYAALEDHPELAWAGRACRKASDAPFAEDHLHSLAGRASQRLASAFHREVRAAGLEVAEWRVLAVLADGRTRSIEELADEVAMKPADIADLVERLLARGALQRQPDRADPVHRIGPAPAGAALVADLVAQARAQEEAALGPYPAEQRTAFRQMLRAIGGTDLAG